MRALRLRHDPASFWAEYWKDVEVDPPRFVDLDIYPIHPTIDYLKRSDRILECGFGAGRVVRHLCNDGYTGVVGVEYDRGAARRVNAVQPCALSVGDIRSLAFRDATFDVSMAFGVLGGLRGHTAHALLELIRVTRPGGLVIVSLMLDNAARRLQKWMNRASPASRRHPLTFYAWMDSDRGWRSYLESFGLAVQERSYMVSRYNFYYWTPFLRKAGVPFDHARARVCDREFRLNVLGEALFRLSKRFAPAALAGAALYVCRR
ncbi:MAG: class I SAM-dependent methyltransferase [Burkholderiales bacterium]|nr:class I SAM-dependent methyltransferase [Burkholderiales bacterium]